MIRQLVLIDTGPLVALLKHQDQFHNWVKQEWSTIQPPLLTCEAVIAETCFLLKNTHRGYAAVMDLLSSGTIRVMLDLNQEALTIKAKMQRFESVPMSLADACLVRMTELFPESSIITLDSDFRIYRKNRNQTISVLMPDGF